MRVHHPLTFTANFAHQISYHASRHAREGDQGIFLLGKKEMTCMQAPVADQLVGVDYPITAVGISLLRKCKTLEEIDHLGEE